MMQCIENYVKIYLIKNDISKRQNWDKFSFKLQLSYYICILLKYGYKFSAFKKFCRTFCTFQSKIS